PTRIAMLKVLASQAAISLENTRLYGDLEEREAKIRRLVNANIIGSYTWNVERRVIEANEGFVRIVGYDREDLLSGRVSWREVTPDKWRAADEQALAGLDPTGVCEPFEKEYFRKDGSRVPVLVGAALLEGSGSEGVAFALDLSERKRAEEALKRSESYLQSMQVELARVSRLTTMGELAASIAHEVNQPLAAIVNNANAGMDFIENGNGDPAVLREILADVAAEGCRAHDIIRNVRNMIKKGSAIRKRVSLNDAVMTVTHMVRSEAMARSCEVHTFLAEDLPVIVGDPVQIQQVLINLVNNAF